MAAVEINLPDVVIEDIFAKANQASAVAQLSRNASLLSPQDHLIYSFEGSDGSFHTPGGPDKAESDDTLGSIEVPVRTLYKILTFDDVDYDDAVGNRMITQITDQLPGILANSYDKAAFGPSVLPSSPFTGFTKPVMNVNDDPNSWMDAYSSVTADGYRPNGWILDNSMEASVRRAASAGVIGNPLSLSVGDGFPLAGAPAYFRDLGGNRGVVGDFRQAVVATYSGLTVEIHSPQSDFTLRKANKYAVYVGLRVGFGVANQDAFQPVAVGATTGE